MSPETEQMPLLTYCLVYVSYYLLMLIGLVSRNIYKPKIAKENANRNGYNPLYNKFEIFYYHYVYRRIRDCWNRPVCSVPGAKISLRKRESLDAGWTFRLLDEEQECLNLGSYNYLGFAESDGPCARAAIEAVRRYGLTNCSPRTELGTTELHMELERLTAEFFGVEAALTFGMGFATNALNIPILFPRGSLILSDEKNHSSIIVGLRLSEAQVQIFRHNDMIDLERLLKNGILEGQEKNGPYVPWRRIFIVVEGVYSMEGTIVKLNEIIQLKKKYKAYVYLDEAHSVGAMGRNGRGVLDFLDCNTRDVDILMGTFTKSFGSAGGYIAGSRALIDYLRAYSYAHTYAMSMSAPVAQQIIESLRILMGRDGTGVGRQRIDQLARNTKYFRRRLHQIGLVVYGHPDSPVVPILVYFYSKVVFLIRELSKMGIATVGVAFPATSLFHGRIRICLSAAHTKQQLDYALDLLTEMADRYGLKYSRTVSKTISETPVQY